MSFHRGRGNARGGRNRKSFHNSDRNYEDDQFQQKPFKDTGDFQRRGSRDQYEDSNKIPNEDPSQPCWAWERLDEESETYFQIVNERMNEPFDDEEEKDLFLVNVVKQMADKEITLAGRSLGSRVLQTILKLNKSPDLIEKLILSLQPYVKELCNNQYGSLVIECMLIKSLEFIAAGSSKECFTALVLSVAEQCAKTFPDVLDLHFQNYVFKTLIHVLSGNILYSNEKKIAPLQAKVKFVEVPDSFCRMLVKLTVQALSLEKLGEWLLIDKFCLALQHMLVGAKHYPELQENIVESILNVMYEMEPTEDELHSFLVDPVASHIVQGIVEVLNKKQRRNFMKKLVNKNIEKFIEHRLANNILRILIKATAKKEHFEKFFEKLEPFFEIIFNLEHDSLLVAIADGCLKFDIMQARFVIALKTILRCSENDKQDHFILCLLHMLRYDQYVIAEAEAAVSISLNGSFLVQRLLNFCKPIKFVMTIINMDYDLLKRILCDRKGSFIMNSFMTSKTVGEKSRDKFVTKIRDIAISLACHVNGSRCIDLIWQNASVKQKVCLADALAKNAEVLLSNQYGLFIHKNLALGHFKSRLDDWKQVQAKQNKKHKLFQDILSDTKNVQTKKFKDK